MRPRLLEIDTAARALPITESGRLRPPGAADLIRFYGLLRRLGLALGRLRPFSGLLIAVVVSRAAHRGSLPETAKFCTLAALP